jgi:hypothetical protein
LRRFNRVTFYKYSFFLLFVAPIFGQSQNHPVSGTKYAYVFNIDSGEFYGWEGIDETFITPQGAFYNSVTYQGSDVFKSSFLF